MKFRVRCHILLCLFALVQIGCTWGKQLDRDRALALQTKVENLIERILHVIQDYYHQIKTELKCIPDEVPDAIMGTLKKSIDCVDKNERSFEGGDITSNAYKKSFLKCFSDAKKEVESTIMSINPELDYCPENMTEKTYQINVTTTFTKTFHINIKNGLEIIRKKIQLGNKEQMCVFNKGDELSEETSADDEIPESLNELSTEKPDSVNGGNNKHDKDKNNETNKGKEKHHSTITENAEDDYEDFYDEKSFPGSENLSHVKPSHGHNENGHDNNKPKGHQPEYSFPEEDEYLSEHADTAESDPNKGWKHHHGKLISEEDRPKHPESTGTEQTDHKGSKQHPVKWPRVKNYKEFSHLGKPGNEEGKHPTLIVPDVDLNSTNEYVIEQPEEPPKISNTETTSTTKRPEPSGPVLQDDLYEDDTDVGDEIIFPLTTFGVQTTQQAVESTTKLTTARPIPIDSEHDDSEQDDEEFIHTGEKEKNTSEGVGGHQSEANKGRKLKPIAKEKQRIQIKPRNRFKVKRRKSLNTERHPIRLPKGALRRSLKMEPLPLPQRVSSETLSLESD